MDDNINEDPAALRLRYHGKQVDGVDVPLAIVQIECRKKFSKKFAATLSRHPHFLFPSVLAGEQATSDALARFHSAFARQGMKVADLTGGLGIDALHMAAMGASVDVVELDHDRAEALRANLGDIDGIRVIEGDCEDYLASLAGMRLDAVFIDPARRNAEGGRVFALADCKPDVVAMLPFMSAASDRIYIKASPMLDVSRVIAELGGVASVTALGTPIECKELFIALASGAAVAQVCAATMRQDSAIDTFSFTLAQEREASRYIDYASPIGQKYLYEPSPCIMKVAPFALLTERFGLRQPHPNTHLFFGDALCPGFPGTRHIVKEVLPYESKVIKRLKGKYPRISVATRNFSLGADALRLKLGVKDGGDLRLFAITTLPDEKFLVVCEEG